MCLADLNEKHKRALEQLEKYFYTNVTKIKDLEAQKKEALKVRSKEIMNTNTYDRINVQQVRTIFKNWAL